MLLEKESCRLFAAIYAMHRQELLPNCRLMAGRQRIMGSGEYIYWWNGNLLWNYMVADAITNYDSFVWVAVGLFITGLFAGMVYERSSSKAKRQQPRPGTSTEVNE